MLDDPRRTDPWSSPAKAGDPVATERAVFTGCPASAGHDDGEICEDFRPIGVTPPTEIAQQRIEIGRVERALAATPVASHERAD
jgi:hypothetical protein